METEVDNTESLTLAALFYEIGRFKSRADGHNGSFLEVGYQWLQSAFPFVAKVVQDNSQLIEQAAKLAAGLKDLPPEQSGDTSALISIFSILNFNAAEHKPHFYAPLKAGNICQYPHEGSLEPNQLKEKYTKLWDGFARECQSLKGTITVPQALLLLEKYTSYIPYVPSPPESPHAGVSLFDHVKLTAALASCLHQARETQLPFLLVGGDFSGVQDFVYRISSKGALKALRGRSFFLELLTEHVINEILRALELSAANIVISAGAIFNLLLPNTERACKALKSAQQKLNEYLLEKHDGKIYLALAAVEVSEDDLVDPEALAEKWRELGQKIAQQKGHKFLDILHDKDQWDAFLRPKRPPDLVNGPQDLSEGVCPWCSKESAQLKRITWQEEEMYGCQACLSKRAIEECQICHRTALLTPLPPPRADVMACSICRNLYHLGEHLYYTRYVIGSKASSDQLDPLQKAIIKLPNLAEATGWIYYYFPLAKTKDSPERAQPEDFQQEFHVLLNDSSVVSSFVINEWDLQWYSLPNARLLALGTYPGFKARARTEEPLQCAEEVPLEFEELVGCAEGMKRLGILRMDVDNLGDVFIQRLQGRSLAHRMALSRAMTYFFKLHLNELCRTESADVFPPGKPQTALINRGSPKMRNVIIVYSGGDDLFIVGTWNDTVELAFDIQQAFEEYTGGSVTLSAGMIVQDEHFPLYQMARFSKKALSVAKANRTTAPSREPDKDSFAIFYPSCILELQGDSLKAHTPAALRWADARKCKELAQEMVEVLGNGRSGDAWELVVSRSLLHNLLRVVKSAHQDGQLSLPKMAYAFSRVSFKDGAKQKQYSKLTEKLMPLQTLCYLHPALVWLEMRLRREEGTP